MTDQMVTFTEDDGSVSMMDAAQAQIVVRDLVAAMLVVNNDKPASTELIRLHTESGSTAYTRWLVEEAVKLAGLYLIHQAGTFEMSVVLRNLNIFILAYRVTRSTSGSDSE